MKARSFILVCLAVILTLLGPGGVVPVAAQPQLGVSVAPVLVPANPSTDPPPNTHTTRPDMTAFA